jgi:hypothetical protein
LRAGVLNYFLEVYGIIEAITVIIWVSKSLDELFDCAAEGGGGGGSVLFPEPISPSANTEVENAKTSKNASEIIFDFIFSLHESYRFVCSSIGKNM